MKSRPERGGVEGRSKPMTASNNTQKVQKIEHLLRYGKEYIVVNQTSWYPAAKWTEEAATADYIFTHENGGWNFMPRAAKLN